MPSYSQAGSVFGGTIDPAELEPQAGEGVLVYDASGNPAFLAPTAAGQFLRENSGGTALEFAAGSGYDVISDTTISGAAANTVSFTSITSGFDLFRLIIIGESDDATGITPEIRFNNDSSAIYEFAGYVINNGTLTGAESEAGTEISLSPTGAGVAQNEDAGIVVDIINDTAHKKFLTWKGHLETNANSINGTGSYFSDTEISRIDVSADFATAATKFKVGTRIILLGHTI